MAKTEKTPNYSEANVARMRAEYLANPSDETVDALTASFVGKTRRSVIAKLVSLGIYVKPEKSVKTAKDEGPTKKDLLAAIEAVNPDFPLEGITPATKDAIAAVLALSQRAAALETEVDAA